MAVYKCKMCGASLEVSENKSIVTCEFCGTCQTVHSFDNEKKITYFRRANALRYKNEFDKASGIYETLVTEYPKEAEAYWGLVLCKYGIEYVDDPKTGEKVPTCHRTQIASIFEDSDYLNAIKYADSVAKVVYKKEAADIDRIQKSIIEVSSKEEPFDIFICYKETDSNGERTKDSVLAQNIYKELVEEGYKVFFSRITLEDKLGSQYEPYIFAALHSSKIMLHVTTSIEHSDSIWVRNEWSRYISLINKGEKKVLIPCYFGMDVYDLPDEMQMLQGQDMGKVGAIQDLIRGIGKIIGKSKKETIQIIKKETNESDLCEARLNIANILLSKSLFNDAVESFSTVIKLCDSCIEAYIGLMLSKAHCKSTDDFLTNPNFYSITSKYLEEIQSKCGSKKTNELLMIEERFKVVAAQNRKKNIQSCILNQNVSELLKEIKNDPTVLEDSALKELIYLFLVGRYNSIRNSTNLIEYDSDVVIFTLLGDYKNSKVRKEKLNEVVTNAKIEHDLKTIRCFNIVLENKPSINDLDIYVNEYIQNLERFKKTMYCSEITKNKIKKIIEEQRLYIIKNCERWIKKLEEKKNTRLAIKLNRILEKLKDDKDIVKLWAKAYLLCNDFNENMMNALNHK